MNNSDNRSLAIYATFSKSSKGRMKNENETDVRTCFQRDRDRILHSSAFRRLKHKTQVFLNEQGDYYRTRLTHTLEVSQISRSIAFALNLNEDLTEAIALSHDLGHPPFGHAGEEILNIKMLNFGGFDHNEQALRIICDLEKRYHNFNGLNLSWETIEGIIKHNGKILEPRAYIAKIDSKFKFSLNLNTSLEGQVAAVADDIAYLTHDFDDGLNAGILKINQIEDLPIINEILKDIILNSKNITFQILTHEFVRKLVSILVNDIIINTKNNLNKFDIHNVDSVRLNSEILVSFSKETLIQLKIIRNFLLKKMWRHPKVENSKKLGKQVIAELFDLFFDKPNELEKLNALQDKSFFTPNNDIELARVITDKISSLTDRNALEIHKNYFKSSYIL
ncbi:MAG: deoxyguanosinetriphosphate triphosphohydrolase [SAR116 cluster bacterium]|nr:deoxyguanosinetriphosphate triphosphohydrolase [SAR116 cluster bacterium]